MPREKPSRTEPRRSGYWPLLIPAVVLAAYIPALSGDVLWDDLGHITAPGLRSLAGLWRIWTEIGATQQYYPMLHSAFWLEHRLWGDWLVGYHLANVALHSAAAFLLVLILRELNVRGALFAGLIFALHPVAVESVAWISEQKNTLSAVFYLASAYVYLRFAQTGLKPCATDTSATAVAQPFRAVDYWLAFVLFICALLSKTVTATLPAALLVISWWQRGGLEWQRHVRPLLPWFAVAALAGATTVWFEREIIGARGADFALTWIERCLLAGRVIWFYVGKLFWPQDLIFIYPRWSIDVSSGFQYLFPAGVIGLAFGLAIVARWYRGPLAGYLYFCGTLVPILGIVDAYPFRFSYVADHFQYLASLGIIVPVTSAAVVTAERLGRGRRRLAAGLACTLIAALAIATWHRSAVYRDAETLYRDTIARNPGAWMAYQNLGTELAAQQRFSEAIDAYEGALRVRPDYREAKNNLVLAHMKLGDAAADAPDRIEASARHYESVLRLEPDHFRAHYNLGTVLMDFPERQAEAIAHLEAAVRTQPENVEARVNLGIALSGLPARRREAVDHLGFALAKRPDLTPVRQLLERLRTEDVRATSDK